MGMDADTANIYGDLGPFAAATEASTGPSSAAQRENEEAKEAKEESDEAKAEAETKEQDRATTAAAAATPVAAAKRPSASVGATGARGVRSESKRRMSQQMGIGAKPTRRRKPRPPLQGNKASAAEDSDDSDGGSDELDTSGDVRALLLPRSAEAKKGPRPGSTLRTGAKE